MGTWEWILIASTQVLVAGGRAGLFWSFLWTCAGYGFLVASLAAMAAMAPTAGGEFQLYLASLSIPAKSLSVLAMSCRELS